jgi:gas vesicle protein
MVSFHIKKEICVLPRKTQAQTVQVEEPVQVAQEPTRLDMLEAFAELVSERYGYYTARRLTQQEMSEAVKVESKAVSETLKALKKNVATYIDEPTDELRTTIKENQKTIEEQRKVLKEKKEPFMKKISPLAKATRYMDSVAIPDSLKELGKPIQPRFSLSKWITDALEASKKKA